MVSERLRFRGFDGLRAIAILLVIAWHGAYQTAFPPAAMGPFRHLVMTGWAGVDLFFALSGFLITQLLLAEEAKNVARGQPQRFRLQWFYVRRALRILPVFYAVFLLNTYVLSASPVFGSVRAAAVREAGSPLGLLPYATFWGNYLVVAHGLFDRPLTDPGLAYVVYWSLCVEEHFYLLWPAFLWLAASSRTRVAVALLACVSILAFRGWAHASHFSAVQVIHVLSHYRIDSILWGAVGALVFHRTRGHDRALRTALVATLAVVVALVASGDLSVLPPGSPLGSGLGLSLLAIGSTLLVLELANHPEGRLARALEWRPLRVVGKLSYAMYLIHFQAIDVGRLIFFATPRAPTLTNFGLSLVLFVALTVAAAWILHVLVERPFLALKARFEP